MTKQTAQGSGGPDDRERTHDAVVRLRREAITRREAAIGVTFSQEGYMRAMADTVPGMDPWNGGAPQGTPKTYLGLPYEVVPGQADEVALVLVPGGSEAAKAFRATGRAQPGVGHGAHQARARMLLEDADTLALMGRQATTAQISDLVMAWADLRPNNPFAAALANAVQKHGRFE